MGRRHRVAVREFREREGLPTYYEVERPYLLARRQWEEREAVYRDQARRRVATTSTLAWVIGQQQRARTTMPRGVALGILVAATRPSGPTRAP